MTAVPVPQAQGIAEHVPLWLRFDWNPETQFMLYRDWGVYYFHRRLGSTAMYNYKKAMEIVNDDHILLYQLSQVQRDAAQIKDALIDARRAAEIAGRKGVCHPPINLQICDALFEINDFESAKQELHNNTRIFTGAKSRYFKDRRMVVDAVIEDVTGRAMSLYFMKNHKLIHKVNELHKANLIIDTRPAWKILRDQKKCDILSIHETEEEVLSPLEVARRKRVFNVIHQTYLFDSWADVLFMKNLHKNPNLELNQCKRSKDILNVLSHGHYDVIRQFIKMLQSRYPNYYVLSQKFPNKQYLKKAKEAYLFRIQYQTHRNMIADLKEIRRLREEKNVKGLADFIELRMSQYYVTKTSRIMCWRFEFINEVYNTLALALCEKYQLPKYFNSTVTSLHQLLLMPIEKNKDIVPFVFGDRSTYQTGDVQDPVALKARKLISCLEKRILFAKYSIEKCYLLHRIASVHLSQLHYDECCFNARRAIKESLNCNSLIWKFLSILEIVKANKMQYKVEKTQEALEEAVPIVNKLKNPNLIRLLEMCLACNLDDTAKKLSSLASRRSSRISAISSTSRNLLE